jgi:DNA-binding IclR family transcriptional regulator
LEELGAVERIDELGIFRIGPSILTMASSADSTENLRALARPELELLADELDEAAGLSVAAGHSMHYIDQVDSDQAVQVRGWVGSRLPMHLVSSGLVVLANWPAESVDNYLERDLEAPTSNSISSRDQLLDRLDRVRSEGVAWTHEELELGINSVAAPIFSGLGEVIGAIHLHGPAYRFPGSLAGRFEREVAESAERVGQSLGAGVVDAVAPGDTADGLEAIRG